MTLNVYALGASRNIGYFATLRLLRKGATVTFLLRSPEVLEKDEQLEPFVRDRKAQFIAGDALNKDDVTRGWEAAQSMVPSGQIDLVLFTVGGTPQFNLKKGIHIATPNLCTRSFLNVLLALKSSSPQSPAQPKVVVVSSIGITHQSHSNLPWLLKPLYGSLIRAPHIDKLGLERVLAYSAGWDWSERDAPGDHILPEDWKSEFQNVGTEGEGLESGWLRHLVVVRPALLTSGTCQADNPSSRKKKPYRTIEGDLGNGYTVSRADVAHFIVEGVLTHWEEYENKGLEIAY